jgi:hypothetical protein
MTYPQVVNGGVSLQIWRVAVNVLHKQLWAPIRVVSPALRLGRGLKNPHCKKPTSQSVIQGLRLGTT